MVDAWDGVANEAERRGSGDDDPVGTGFSDVSLVVAVTRGRRDALAEVYSRHGAQVYGMARRLGGEGRAEEVAQQVFVELWEQPHRYDPDRWSLRTFLLTRAYRHCVARVPGDGARRAPESARGPVRASPVAGIEPAVVTLSAGDDVWPLVRALPGGQRDAVVLASCKGYTYRDVAELLEEPEATIKSRIRAGLTRLRFARSDEGAHSARRFV